MDYRCAEIVSRLLLTGSVFVAAVNTGDIHGMELPKVDIRGLMVNADEDNMEYYTGEVGKANLSHLINLGVLYYRGEDVGRDLDTAEQYFEKAAQLGHVPSKIFLQAIHVEKKSPIASPFNKVVLAVIINALQGDLTAQYKLGYFYYIGEGVAQNYEIAAKWFSYVVNQKFDSNILDEKDAINKAHLLLAKMYHQGMGVEADSKKAAQHIEIPALDLYFISQSNDFYISFLEHGSRDENLMLYANYIAVFLGVKKTIKWNEKFNHNNVMDSVVEEFSAFLNQFPLSNFNKSFKIICNNQHKNGIGFYFYGVSKKTIAEDSITQANCDYCLMSLLMGKSFGNKEARDILNKIRNNKTYPGCKPEKFSKLKKTLAVVEGRAPKSASKPDSEKTQKSPIKTNNDNAIRKVPLSVDKPVLQSVLIPNIVSSNLEKEEAVKEPLDRVKVEQAQTLFLTALACFEGKGVNKDLPRALALFKSSADLGNIAAQRSVGVYYMTGSCSAPMDYTLALKYLRLAADAGDVASQKNLGLMYLEGFGVEQDSTKAFELFVLAANGGNKSAAECLAHMKQDGINVKIERDNVEKYPENKVSNDISTKSQKKKVNNTGQLKKDTSQIEQGESEKQSSKKTATQHEQKDVAISSKRNRRIDRHVSEAGSSHNTTSPLSVKEEKLPEIKQPQKTDTVEIKDDTYDGIQNNSFPVSDPADLNKKVKKKFKIKIPKGPKWLDHRSETKEKKEKKSKKNVVVAGEKTATEESSIVSASFADSDDKSHISVSMSESEMSESYIEVERKDLNLNQQITCDLMKKDYPDLYKFINKSGVDNINQLKFNSHRLIKNILLQMIADNVIEMTHFKCSKISAKVVGNKIGDGNIKCVIHATHALWYKDSDKIKHFFEFIAKSDSLIYDFLKIYFGENCFSRDLTTSVNTNNNSPSRNDNKGNESKPD